MSRWILGGVDRCSCGAVFISCWWGWQQLCSPAAERQRWRKSWRSFVGENRQTGLESVQTVKEGQEWLWIQERRIPDQECALLTHWGTGSVLAPEDTWTLKCTGAAEICVTVQMLSGRFYCRSICLTYIWAMRRHLSAVQRCRQPDHEGVGSGYLLTLMLTLLLFTDKTSPNVAFIS